MLIGVLAALLLIPGDVPMKAGANCPSTSIPTTPRGGVDGVPCSWLQPGLPLASASIWELNQEIEELSPSLFFCLSHSPYNSAFKIYINEEINLER